MNIRPFAVATLMLSSLSAVAADPFVPEEVSDGELAQLRGRYVLPDRIISFGVVMNSSWQNGAGQVVGAQVALNLGAGQVQPSLTVSMIDQAGGTGNVAAGTGQIIGGAGLGSVQGVVQSVRTAGDYNSGLNDVAIRVTRGADAATQAAGGQPWKGDQRFGNSAGVVTVSAANGGLNIGLQAAGGQGTSSQQLSAGGLAQQANIAGTLNMVRNLAELNVALREENRNVNIINCLEQLRTLRQ